MSIDPLAKDGCTYAHHVGAVVDGDGVVVAHAPRAVAERGLVGKVLDSYLVEEAVGGVHLAGYLVVVIGVGCHHHESAYLHMLHLLPFAVGEQIAAVVGGKSVLGGFLCDVQFQQYADATTASGSLFLYLAQQSDRIYRLYHADIGSYILHLVGL